nr:serine/threonine-protein kinase [Candidatus Syntrophosphaera sp.]
MILKPGDLIRNYRVLDYIGEGGMGKVYAAEEELLGRKVAIKMLDPAVTHQEHFRQRFINEARILSQLQHPHIVGLFTFFLEQESYFMVMEYAEGQTLRDLIATIGPVPEQRTRRILRQILAALDYAQTKGVVHRDIKPSNIMIGDRDDLKILDFGVARILANPQSTLTGSRLGTIYYMSPEQVRSPRDVDSRSDIYSTGVVLYEMLTGRLPFSTETESDFLIEKEIVERPLPHPREHYPYMSDLIVDLMNAMTAKEPSLRFQLNKKTAAVESNGRQLYLASLALSPGRYHLEGISGIAAAFPFVGNFFIPVVADFEVEEDSVSYFGHVAAIMRERREGEFRAGAVIP